MADRFYTPEPLTPGEFALTGAEAHHLQAVRRITVGETIQLFNGDGFEYPAEVIGVGKKSVLLQLANPIGVNREYPTPLWVASAIPKGDRLDFLIEKLTELGVSRFVPLIAERSAVRPKADVVAKYERIVIEASKQCGRNVLMKVEPPVSWSTFSDRDDLPGRRLILGPGASSGFTRSAEPVVVAVGPEGGWTDRELERAGWATVSLGPTVLRIETAAIAAAARQRD